MGEAIFGIVGTILGTILGWLLNSISNKGKLVFSVASWEDSFQRNDNMGSMVPSNSIEETQVYSYKLFLDVYNSSAETLIMRDIRIALMMVKMIFISAFPRMTVQEEIVVPCRFMTISCQ